MRTKPPKSTDPKLQRDRIFNEPKTYRTITLTADQDTALLKAAYKADMSISQYVRTKLFETA